MPPAVGRLGAELTSVEPRATTVRLPMTEELLLPGGTPSGAVTALLADMALTTSVIASLPNLRGVATISMTVDHHGVPPRRGALLSTATAEPYADGRPQHASGVVRDEDSRLVATVSGWFLAAPADAVAVERVGLVREPPAAHLHDLLNVPAGPTFTLQARDALSNALGSLHGGIGALAAQLAAAAALPPGWLPLTTTFAYLRPTPREGAVRVAGTVVRQGRRTALARSSISDADDRTLVTATLVAAAP